MERLIPRGTAKGPSMRVMAAWMELDQVLREEHEITAAMLVCLGKEGYMWTLCSPFLDEEEKQDLLAGLREGPVRAA